MPLMLEDAPPPVDADEPPPRKRGLGRGLDDLATSGRSIGIDGQPYYSLDAVLWALDRNHAKAVAARTPQPKALHRLPEPAVDTGSFRVADIMGAGTDTPAPTAPEVPKPRTLSESAAMLVRGLPGMSEALRAAERTPEPVAASPAAPAVEPETPAKRSRWAFLEDDDD